MQTVPDEVETIHLYVVRDHEKKPYTLLPLLGALLCLLGIAAITFYSAQHPSYEHQRLTVPAEFLPPKTFRAEAPIIPTGIKTYTATTAHGWLTFSNGSIIGQSIPAGFTVVATNGVPVVTDAAVYVPAATANGFGKVTVSARLGRDSVNLPPYSVNLVIGSSLFVRNLSPFTGGRPAYSVKVVIPQDKQTALLRTRGILLGKSSGLHSPCVEDHSANASNMVVTWRCRFVQPPHVDIPNARITSIHLLGKNLLVDVMFIAQPQRYWAK